MLICRNCGLEIVVEEIVHVSYRRQAIPLSKYIHCNTGSMCCVEPDRWDTRVADPLSLADYLEEANKI